MVRFCGVLIGVERGADAQFTDGMGEKLQAALIELGDRGIVFCGLPEKFALGGRIVAVRVEHRRGVRFDDAVHHEFYCVGIHPGVMIFLASAFDGVQILGPHFRWVHEVGDIKAQGQIAVPAQFVVKLELWKIAAGAVNACQAMLIGPFDTVAKSGKFFRAGRFRHKLTDQAVSRFFQSASGFMGSGVAIDDSVWRIRRVVGDARDGQCLGVCPIRVTVVALQQNRAVRKKFVEIFFVGEGGGAKHGVIPAATE